MNSNNLKHYIREILRINYNTSIAKEKNWEEQHEQFMIVKAMHGVEKGLSLKEVKKGFGVPKIKALLKRIDAYYQKGYDCSNSSIGMALAAINKYVDYFSEMGALDEEIKKMYEDLSTKISFDKKSGGTVHVTKDELLSFDKKEFEKIIYSRHSLRNFTEEPIDMSKLLDSIKLANQCPCACNRQSTKVHIIDSEDGLSFLANHLEGVGGFAKDCKTFLLVTGNISAFEITESNQWIVNAGIFIGTLVLTLHSNGIGSCVIQRPLVRSKKITALREKFNIKDNEEIICAIALGNYPDSFDVPKSTRLDIEQLYEKH